ncbi:MAG: hypothetical protein K0R00_1857 [Herbinix sp.]|jgi:spore germination protein|nr:hypothetical protein [Herbinix sp.]
MEIYVVQPEDTLVDIARKYGVTVEKLAADNGLPYPYNLITGQALVITYPKTTHVISEGETIESIADRYQVSVMQILRNNPYLSDREFIYPGESLVISYNTKKTITTNGFAYPFIKMETLIKTLPNLTYLSIFNYTVHESGNISTFHDDTDILNAARQYGTIPLLFLTTLTYQGEPNIELTYRVLLDEEYQSGMMDQFISIMKQKGYYGVNLILNNLTKENQLLYQNLLRKAQEKLQAANLLFFVTVNYSLVEEDGTSVIEDIDYLTLSQNTQNLTFINLTWGSIDSPPEPVSDINYIRMLVDFVVNTVPPEKIVIGAPVIGYDWELPYVKGRSSITSLTINSTYSLAYQVGAIIEFDEASQTPYYYYNRFGFELPSQHIVWFVDARSIDGLCKIIIDKNLNGSGVWNIMIYYTQLWTIINAEFDVIKLI